MTADGLVILPTVHPDKIDCPNVRLRLKVQNVPGPQLIVRYHGWRKSQREDHILSHAGMLVKTGSKKV